MGAIFLDTIFLKNKKSLFVSIELLWVYQLQQLWSLCQKWVQTHLQRCKHSAEIFFQNIQSSKFLCESSCYFLILLNKMTDITIVRIINLLCLAFHFLFNYSAILHASCSQCVSRVISGICDYVCVCTVKGKRLQLSTRNLVHTWYMHQPLTHKVTVTELWSMLPLWV